MKMKITQTQKEHLVTIGIIILIALLTGLLIMFPAAATIMFIGTIGTAAAGMLYWLIHDLVKLYYKKNDDDDYYYDQ